MEINHFVINGSYYDLYPLQYSIIIFMYGLVCLFNNSTYLIFQLINIFSLGLSFYCIYKTMEIYCENKELPKYIMLMLILFLPFSMYITFVYGNLIGFSFASLAIWLQAKYLKTEKIGYIIGMVISITIAIFVKTNYSITLIAMILLFLAEVVLKKKIKYLISVALLIICYLIITPTTNHIMKNITGGLEISSGTPSLSWIAMGMQEGNCAPGWINRYNITVYQYNDFNTEKAKQASNENIKQSLNNFKNNPDYALKFYSGKIASQWNNPTFQCIWINQGRKPKDKYSPLEKSVLDDGVLSKVITQYSNLLQTIILFGTVLYIVIDYKKIKLPELIFAIIFIGGFIFHIIWEAKCQYTLPYFVLIIPYSVIGYYKLAGKFEKKVYKSGKI